MRSTIRHLPALLGAALLFGALYAVQREFHHLRLDDIGAAIAAIPLRALGFGFLCTVLSYAVLTLYDRLGTIYAGHKVRYGRVAFASFCAYALSHNLGFAAVSGAAVRYRLYAHWGLTPVQIAKTVAFCSLTFGLGAMVLGGIILFIEPEAVPFFGDHVPLWIMYAAGALLWGIVAAYVTLARIFGTFRLFGHEVTLPDFRMAVLQALLATADVAVTATIFWVLLPPATGLSWLIFLGIYLASYSAGLAANIPGGIGVFDSVMLFGLAPYVDAPRVVAAIVIFRLYYYVIPLFLAGSLFAANEAFLRGGLLGRRFGGAALGRWSEPDFEVAAATGAVALSGLLVLAVGMLVPRGGPAWADPDLADLASQAGEFVPSLLGAGLVVLAVGLVQRVRLAWWATVVVLICGAAFIAAQGDRLWLAGVLAVTAVLLAPLRADFYRRARLFSDPLDASSAASLLALVVCVLALAGFRRRVHGMSGNAWWEIVLSDSMPLSLRASVALTVGLALVALWLLLRPGRVAWAPWDGDARSRLATLGVRPAARPDGVVWGETERAGIPFRRFGRVLLALGDPAGAEADRVSAVWRMRDLARQEGRDPAVWRAGPDLLKVYNDLGLAALPLGADGLPLPESADDPPPAAQYLVCVAERDLGLLLPLLPRLFAGDQVTTGAQPPSAGRAPPS